VIKSKSFSIFCLVSCLFTSLNGSIGLAKIALQPHQSASIQYLNENPAKKGLLLFHSLGSGKTYIALDYTENHPDKKVLILLPEFLKSNWVTQMTSYGVKNTSRYELVSFNEPEKILNYDLKNTIVIVDEVHKLVQKIRLSDFKSSEQYINLYQKVRTAEKLIVLTGTPIFTDTSDISYIANLFDPDEKYPVDPIKFRTEYMRIKPVTSLVRGHITESKLMMVGVPFLVTLGALVTLGTSLPWTVPLFALSGSAIIPVTNELYPVNQVTFREFDTEKWKDFSSQYVSYYNVKLTQNENYPQKKVVEKTVSYSESQANFFLNFVDADLSVDQVKILLGDESSKYSDSFLKIHSSKLQTELLGNTLSGREIGNLEFKRANGSLSEAPKFQEVLRTVRSSPGQVAVYSSYFTNGIKKFATFLDRNGMKDQYAILSTDQSTQTQTEILESYNQRKKRILLIHPDITEGISLVGTEQFHILEPLNNTALQEQIIGRAIRYRSHAHLPESRRVVKTYLWESTINYSDYGVPTSAGLLKREHWQRKYAEVNPSMWSKGILEIDPNYFLKNETPDSRVKRLNSVIQKDTAAFQELLETSSIEKSLN
jgi:superfamily II DNA or RNA helicase